MNESEANRVEASTPIPVVEIPCPLCESTKHSCITSTPDFVYSIPGEYSFVRCDACRHMFISPRPADDAIMRCYPTRYEPHTSALPPADSAESDSADRRSLPRRVLRSIPLLRRFLFWLGTQHATVIPELPNGDRRLLEIGCAHGVYLQQAATAGWQVDGIEPSDAAASRARQLGFDVLTSMFTDAEVQSESRQAIVAWMVLEHVPDPVPFVNEAYRVLSPGGVCAVSVPNGGGFERPLFGKYWLGYDAPRHLQVFTPRTITRLFREAGFVDIQVIHQSSIRYWWGSVAAWGLAKRPRSEWPRRWLGYYIGGQPRWMRIASLIPEKILSLLHLSGRITIVAKKPA